MGGVTATNFSKYLRPLELASVLILRAHGQCLRSKLDGHALPSVQSYRFGKSDES